MLTETAQIHMKMLKSVTERVKQKLQIIKLNSDEFKEVHTPFLLITGYTLYLKPFIKPNPKLGYCSFSVKRVATPHRE